MNDAKRRWQCQCQLQTLLYIAHCNTRSSLTFACDAGELRKFACGTERASMALAMLLLLLLLLLVHRSYVIRRCELDTPSITFSTVMTLMDQNKNIAAISGPNYADYIFHPLYQTQKCPCVYAICMQREGERALSHRKRTIFSYRSRGKAQHMWLYVYIAIALPMNGTLCKRMR